MASGIEGRDVARAGRESPLRRGLDAVAGARPATLLFAAAAAASAALMLLLGSRLTFLADDWAFLLDRRGFNAAALLEPHAENIVIGPVLVYKALLASVGMDSALPFRVVSVAAFIASVAVLFVYLRRRVGEWPALAGAAAVLFLGAGWEILLSPFHLGYSVSMGAGLGALLAIERADRRGYVAACVLLTASVLFSGLGLAFLVGAAVALALGPRGAWRDGWFVVAVPAALYVLWWAGWGHDADSGVGAVDIATAPVFLVDGFASSISSLFGLATPRDESTIGALDWGRPLLVVALVCAGWLLWRRRTVPNGLIVVTAIAVTFWLWAGIHEEAGRDPLLSRYQYVGVIAVLLIAAELLRGERIGRGALAAIFLVLALAVPSNVDLLHQRYRTYRVTSQIERADLAALEIARGIVPDEFLLTQELAHTDSIPIAGGPYLSAADDYGSPAYAEGELAVAPEAAREAADSVLAAALGLDVSEPSGEQRGCLEVHTGPDSVAVWELPPGGAVVRAPAGAGATLRLRRFAETFSINAGTLAPGEAVAIEIPSDNSARPWQLEVETGGVARICGVANPQ